MKMKHLLFTAILFATAAPSLHAQEPLNYNLFLQKLEQNNPLAERAGNNEDLGKYTMRSAAGNFDPVLAAELETKQFAGKEYYQVAEVVLRQPVFSAHQLKAGYDYGTGFLVNPRELTPSDGIPYLGIEANLLQGLTFDKRRAEVIKARHYNDFYRSEQRILLNNLMFLAGQSYAEYLLHKEVADLNLRFVNLASTRLEAIAAMTATGERAAVDSAEAAILLQDRQQALQSSRIKLEQLSNQLRSYKVMDASAQVVASDSLSQLYRMFRARAGKFLNPVNAENPVLVQYRSKQKILETDMRLQREMIKPVLSVQYNFLQGVSSSVTGAKVSGRFAMPLFLRSSRNDYKISRIMSENNRLEMEAKDLELFYKRQYLLGALKYNEEQVVRAEQTIVFTRRLLEAEAERFFSGESSLFMVNNREIKLLESQVKLAEYKFRYIQLCLEYIYQDGTLSFLL